jgi:hypothetical protein
LTVQSDKANAGAYADFVLFDPPAASATQDHQLLRLIQAMAAVPQAQSAETGPLGGGFASLHEGHLLAAPR